MPKFIPALLVYYGGGPQLLSSDAARMARFDLIDIDRFRYNQVGTNTWESIRAINPNVIIVLYQMGPETQNFMDSDGAGSLNGLGRYDVSRGHSMGSLNVNQQQLYLLDAGGQRVYSRSYSDIGNNKYWHLMDFGSVDYADYWIEATRTDVVNQPWKADGIFADNCLTDADAGGYNQWPAKYPEPEWPAAMNKFCNAIAAGCHRMSQKLAVNKGETRWAHGADIWRELDTAPDGPDILFEEGAFVVEWGSDAQFYAEEQWRCQVDCYASMRRVKAALMSHTTLVEGQTGTTNWNKPVTFHQCLYYAIGSMLLAKQNDNCVLMFSSGTAYNKLAWYDEFDHIDFGQPVGPYKISVVSGVNIYMREFEHGYVAVNPTQTDVTCNSAVPLRLVTPQNLYTPVADLPVTTSYALPANHAALLYKNPSPPPAQVAVPINFAAVATSPTSTQLSWNTPPGTIAGYVVYLDGNQIGSTAATSFCHTGLTPATTYRYRVSAYDPSANHSAWTPELAVTTPPLAVDTQVPTTPTGLRTMIVTGNSITLDWIASTDAVGVTGYYIYLDDQILASVQTPRYTHNGLSRGTVYHYRVSAHDAAMNHSPWTPVLAVRTKWW